MKTLKTVLTSIGAASGACILGTSIVSLGKVTVRSIRKNNDFSGFWNLYVDEFNLTLGDFFLAGFVPLALLFGFFLLKAKTVK